MSSHLAPFLNDNSMTDNNNSDMAANSTTVGSPSTPIKSSQPPTYSITGSHFRGITPSPPSTAQTAAQDPSLGNPPPKVPSPGRCQPETKPTPPEDPSPADTSRAPRALGSYPSSPITSAVTSGTPEEQAEESKAQAAKSTSPQLQSQAPTSLPFTRKTKGPQDEDLRWQIQFRFLPLAIIALIILAYLGMPWGIAFTICLLLWQFVVDYYFGFAANTDQMIVFYVAAMLGLLWAAGFRAFIGVLIASSPIVLNVYTMTRSSPRNSDPYPPVGATSDSVGWVNHALHALFPLISAEVLTPFIDMLEDALVQQVPPVVSSVRLTSASLGIEPLVLTSMRVISNEEWQASLDYQQPDLPKGRVPRQSTPPTAANTSTRRRTAVSSANIATDFGDKTIAGQPASTQAWPHLTTHSTEPDSYALAGNQGPEENAQAALNHSEVVDEDEDARQYVNYEVGFAYKIPPSVSAQGLGLHAVAHFGVGIKNVAASELPVFVDVVELKGKMIVRILLSATPPFVRKATMSFLSMPEFSISARPLRSMGFGSINVFDIPLLKQYLQKSIAQVAGSFVRPKSYSLDVDRLLIGHESFLRTEAVGVFYIIIHWASDLPKTDAVGKSDPYVVLSYSKFTKPVFSTRTIIKDLNPVWEEQCFMLVLREYVTEDVHISSASEKVRLTVFDSDRFGTDDAVGMVEVPVMELVMPNKSGHHPGLKQRTDMLKPVRPGAKAQGSLTWSVGYFPEYKMSKGELAERVQAQRDTRGEGYVRTTPAWLDKWIETPDFEKEREKRRKEWIELFSGDRYREEAEALAKPPLEFPAGVLQFHIHQSAEMQIESLEGTYSGSSMSRRKSAASGKPALSDLMDRAPYENPDPPSTYIEVSLNHKIVYRTRTKHLSPMPYFNAVSERFVVDWRQSEISFAVRDERVRQHSPLLGIVNIPLKEALKHGSQVTKWYSISGGIGFGRLKISLLFKPVLLNTIPRSISGYEAATLDIQSLSTTPDLTGYTMRVETEYDARNVEGPEGRFSRESTWTSSRKSLDRLASGQSTPSKHDSHTLTPPHGEVAWSVSSAHPLRLAIMYRHSLNLVFSFTQRRVVKKSKILSVGVLRLDDCSDYELVTRHVPVWDTPNINKAMHATQQQRQPSASGGVAQAGQTGPQIIGWLTVTFMVHPGLSQAHRKITKRDGKIRSAYEIWQASRESEALDDLDMDSRAEDSDESDSDLESPRADPEAIRASQALHLDDSRGLIRDGAKVKAYGKENRFLRSAHFFKDKLEERLLTTGEKANLERRPRGVDAEVEREGQSHF